MKDAHTAAMMIAPDLGISSTDLISEEETCDTTGCYQWFYYAFALSDADFERRLTSSPTYTWVYSRDVHAWTKPHIDIYAKHITLISGKPPVSTPTREWTIAKKDFSINGNRYLPGVTLYAVSTAPNSYMANGKPLSSNIIRISLKAF